MQGLRRRGGVVGLLLVLMFGIAACSKQEVNQPDLPHLQTDTERVYLAGLSSGGYLVHQLHLAWPYEIRGVAVFAAGPYACAEAGVTAALFNCMAVSRGAPTAAATLAKIAQAYQKDHISNPQMLASSRVYLYRAGADPVIAAPVMQVLEETYAQLAPEGLLTHVQPQAGHGLPSLDAGVACNATAAPYVNACGYSGAAASLQHLDGAPRRQVQTEPQGEILEFNQQPFKALGSKNLADTGFYYVPEQCQEGGCGTLIVLHGCEQAAEQVGSDFVRLSGFLPEADARNLVVVFPQIKSSLANPKSCWDWWGYESSAFATRGGPQMQSLRAIWQHLAH